MNTRMNAHTHTHAHTHICAHTHTHKANRENTLQKLVNITEPDANVTDTWGKSKF